jgi:hypothetical protein
MQMPNMILPGSAGGMRVIPESFSQATAPPEGGGPPNVQSQSFYYPIEMVKKSHKRIGRKEGSPKNSFGDESPNNKVLGKLPMLNKSLSKVDS